MDKKRNEIQITTDAQFSRIFINGEEIKRVKSVRFEHTAGNLPLVTLEIIPDMVNITGLSDVMESYALLSNKGIADM